MADTAVREPDFAAGHIPLSITNPRVTTDFQPINQVINDFKPVAKVKPEIAPSPFPVDGFVNEIHKDFTPEEKVEKSDGLTKVFKAISDPFLGIGFNTYSALNRGSAGFYENLDTMARWLESQGVGKREGVFDELAKIANRNADYWKERADQVGINFLGEMISELAGGAIPGITDFALKVASGFSIPAVIGVQQAKEHDTDPFIGGLVEAAKTKTLDSIFKMVAPFNKYLQSLVLGTTFGVQDAVEAPEGQKMKGFAKGAGTGVGLALMSPSGKWGIKDIYPEVGTSVPEIREQLLVREQSLNKDITQKLEKGEPLETPKTEIPKGEPTPLDRKIAQQETKINQIEQGISVGAAAEGTITGPPDLIQLSQTLNQLPQNSTLKERLDLGNKASKTWTGILSGPKNAWEKIKGASEASWDWYTRPPKWTEFDDMLGKYLGGRQISGKQVSEFAKDITDKLTRTKREAIVNYIQAEGDITTLQNRMNQTTDPILKKGYEDALRLTPDEMAFADNVHQYFNSMLNRGIDAGILEHGVENYVNQIWEKKDNPVAKKLISEINAGMLKKNPSFAKKRIFESYFDGEQAGFLPKNKDIGYLISVYQQSFNEAIQARAFVKSLLDGKAADGRPTVSVRGSGSELPKGTDVPEAYLIRPTTKPEEAFDYREISHPALRKWKWVSKDAEGNPIFVEGDLIAHPEIYDHLKNVLSKSAIQESGIGKTILRGSAELKGTLLSLSAFHQVQIGVHAAFHMENPFGAPKIDFEKPIQRDLVEHGLMVYNHNALSEFSEGLTTAGLTNKVPVVGTYLQKYGQYLFQDLIPRLKMKLAEDMVERNTPRYPNLSRDQILKLSSDQANAAFGELNYKQMGRNPTLQSMFRIGALAPDFLEARMRFVGQALRPYGKEQAVALIRGATAMYMGAKIIEAIAEQVDPDKNEIHWDRPFSITIDGKEYSLRSIPGDIYHLVRDSRSFIYHRLNPATTKPLIEAITQRDIFGKKRDVEEEIKDFVTGFVPIPAQGIFTKQDRTIYDSILQSMGISSYKSRTEAEKLARDIQFEKSRMGEIPKETQARMDLRRKLGKDYEKNQDISPVTDAVGEGKITFKDAQSILERSLTTDLERGVKGFNIPESMKIWKAANSKEKALIQPIIIKHWMNWKATEEERNAFMSQYEKVLEWENPQGGQK